MLRILSLLLVLFPNRVMAQPALSLLEQLVALKYSAPQIEIDSFARRIASQDRTRLLILDVRSPNEFAVSHIQDAIRVDPDITGNGFARTFADTIKGKDLIFYCSVGYRSSILLARVQQHALEAGAISLANLRGGIFRWYNEQRPVVRYDAQVDTVHPYNALWGQLLRKRDTF